VRARARGSTNRGSCRPRILRERRCSRRCMIRSRAAAAEPRSVGPPFDRASRRSPCEAQSHLQVGCRAACELRPPARALLSRAQPEHAVPAAVGVLALSSARGRGSERSRYCSRARRDSNPRPSAWEAPEGVSRDASLRPPTVAIADPPPGTCHIDGYRTSNARLSCLPALSTLSAEVSGKAANSRLS
jgi:hypothetical protein